ncbi:MAG: hypothetical protein H3C28_08905 [Sphingomonadales bacterium]|nr:hypothetical protein [Sphingomonadales bacterium]
MTTEQTPGDAAPARSPSTDSTAAAKRRGVSWVGVIVVLAALAIAAVLILPAVRSWIPALDEFLGGAGTTDTAVEEELSAVDSALTSLAQRLEAQDQRLSNLAEEVLSHGSSLNDLDRRLGAIEERAGIVPPAGGVRTSTANVITRIEMLAARVSQLESAFVPLRDRAQDAIDAADALKDQLAAQDRLGALVSSLEQRIASLEQSAAADGRGAIIAIAFSALRDVANRGRPFSVEYETLHGLLSEGSREELAAALRAIAPFAASGAPTLAVLRAQFSDAIPGLLEAARTPADASWWRRFTARLASLVTIRPVGEVAGAEPRAVMARMERRLIGNDLAGALREFAVLPPGARAAAEPWAAEARKRQALDEALAAFAAILLREVANGPSPAAAGDK